MRWHERQPIGERMSPQSPQWRPYFTMASTQRRRLSVRTTDREGTSEPVPAPRASSDSGRSDAHAGKRIAARLSGCELTRVRSVRTYMTLYSLSSQLYYACILCIHDAFWSLTSYSHGYNPSLRFSASIVASNTTCKPQCAHHPLQMDPLLKMNHLN